MEEGLGTRLCLVSQLAPLAELPMIISTRAHTDNKYPYQVPYKWKFSRDLYFQNFAGTCTGSIREI